jgi:hypothetical protein
MLVPPIDDVQWMTVHTPIAAGTRVPGPSRPYPEIVAGGVAW